MKYLGPPQSGSQAGTTASHNRAGQYYRNRRSPVQPIGTGRRAVARSNFGASSSGWSALTFSQQAAWTAYADSHPVVDSLGSSIKLTGAQMYVSINSQLLNCAQPQSPTPPATSDVFPASPVIFSGTSTGFLTVLPSALGAPADFLLLAFSAPKSSGVTFNKTFWQGTVVPGDSATPIDVSALYIAQFGIPPLNSRVFIRATPVNQYGVKGVDVIQFAQIVAGGTPAVATAGAATIITWTYSGADPAQWWIQESADGGLTWTGLAAVTGTLRTFTGATTGNLARVYGVDSTGAVIIAPSNSITVA